MIGTWRRAAVFAAAALALLVTLTCGVFYGYLSSQYELPLAGSIPKVLRWAYRGQPTRVGDPFYLESEKGRWGLARESLASDELTDEQREEMAQLQTLGYLDGYEPASGLTDVTTYVPGMAFDGLNLYASGHRPAAFLMDMEGRVLHEWSLESPFPDHGSRKDHVTEFWRRVHLYENGDLLAIFDGIGLIKLDRDSNLIWAVPNGAHHDLHVDENGWIYVLTREAKIVPRLHPTRPVLEDYVTILDADGTLVRRVSILEAFERSTYAPLLSEEKSGNILHTNTLELLDGSLQDRSPVLKKGNVLISVLMLDVIAIVDLDEEKVVWALSGQWRRQHQPTLLDNGSILLLDNEGRHGMSKVIEIDPFTQEIKWAYEGNAENGFYTRTCGSNQRLPNGNTLITESDSGRAFEVTPDKRTVWEYYNPARAGREGELIATLFEVIRLPADFPTHWLDAQEEASH